MTDEEKHSYLPLGKVKSVYRDGTVHVELNPSNPLSNKIMVALWMGDYDLANALLEEAQATKNN